MMFVLLHSHHYFAIVNFIFATLESVGLIFLHASHLKFSMKFIAMRDSLSPGMNLNEKCFCLQNFQNFQMCPSPKFLK